ncbi:unnamed protein product [Caenorhabditis auriculariae]|uniref:Non-lysosomal glucosylceramidase n=1 Tax=Caenorhabditis auriculariae TaxID=2777116 RepID=A0A8S1GP21_9PELO|nr:unnamed protein product [Caenorhabditis auriculariae]
MDEERFRACWCYCNGLYPRSWTCYHIPEVGLNVTIRQISPVLPNNYEDSSLPVSAFVVDVENFSEHDYEVSVAFTFRNGTGNRRWERESECGAAKFVAAGSQSFAPVCGAILSHSIANMPCAFGLATSTQVEDRVTTSVCQRFDPSQSGVGVWATLSQTGDLPLVDEDCAKNSREMAIGVCNRFHLTRTSKRTVDYSLSWDMPRVSFGSLARTYLRRYATFFGGARGAVGGMADALCVRALRRRRMWETAIDEWQSPVLDHPLLPSWYKSALFNELYFMTDGGSVWFAFDDGWTHHENHLSEYTKSLMRKHGRFGYLESWEYRMVNTYDVHFYASYALAVLWPQLELAVQSEFTDQVYHTIDKQIKFHMEGDWANLKTASRVPHDLGNPADEPWIATNAYVMHDTGKWKDLNMKYVLTSWRDYVALTDRDSAFLQHTWPAVQNIMLEAMESWDKDRDGMIENFGKADQTYDAWQMEGVSAYCGSLWLASLRVSAEMATAAGEDKTASLFSETLGRARKVFIRELWTGRYFRFCQRSRSRETVMADQLCGYWFLQSVSPELATDLLPEEMVRSALATIYDLNVCRFGNGNMGAVNGMRPDGRVDREYIQADEMWTGVTYAVAALLIQQGEISKAFQTAAGSYDSCFERLGLQYQTPEAIYETKFYRAIGYMRPLSIWAMQWALERHRGLHTPREDLSEPLFRSQPLETAAEPSTSEDSGSLGYVSDFRDDRDESSVSASALRPPAPLSSFPPLAPNA